MQIRVAVGRYGESGRDRKLTWWQRQGLVGLRLKTALPLIVMDGIVAVPCQRAIVVRHRTSSDMKTTKMLSSRSSAERRWDLAEYSTVQQSSSPPLLLHCIEVYPRTTVLARETYAMMTWHGRVRWVQ